jgi:hypothetical protein
MCKFNTFKLSEQVKEILFYKGLLAVFNYADYREFRDRTRNFSDRAEKITELFIRYNNCAVSDFAEYEF